jgi:hypothetical protein
VLSFNDRGVLASEAVLQTAIPVEGRMGWEDVSLNAGVIHGACKMAPPPSNDEEIAAFLLWILAQRKKLH